MVIVIQTVFPKHMLKSNCHLDHILYFGSTPFKSPKCVRYAVKQLRPCITLSYTVLHWSQRDSFSINGRCKLCVFYSEQMLLYLPKRGAQWLSGRASDSGARDRRFETYLRVYSTLSRTSEGTFIIPAKECSINIRIYGEGKRAVEDP